MNGPTVRQPLDRAAPVLLGLAVLVYAALAMWLTRGGSLFVDETELYLSSSGLDLETLLTPLNGHLIAVERAFVAIDLGLGADFVALRLAEVAGASLAALACFVYAARRVGPTLALAPAILLLFLGTAWEITVIPAGIANTWCAAAGVGALLALEREDRRGDAIAAGLLVVSIASWTLGVIFAAGAALAIALRPGVRGRIWVAALPLGLYVLWYAWLRVLGPEAADVQNIRAINLLLVPSFVAQEAAAVGGALAGLNYDRDPEGLFATFSTASAFGAVIAALGGVAILAGLRRRGLSAGAVVALAMLLGFWFVLALSVGPGRSPDTARYVYPSAVLILLVAVEALRATNPGRNGLLAVLVVTVLALGANLARARDGTDFYRDSTEQLTAQLAAVEIAGDAVEPEFEVGTFPRVEAGRYLGAVERNGSVAPSEEELAAAPSVAGQAADATLIEALGIVLDPAPPGAARSCGPRRRLSLPAELELEGSAVLRTGAPARVELRRFGIEGVEVGELAGGAAGVLRIPPDSSDRPWIATVAPTGAAGGRLIAC